MANARQSSNVSLVDVGSVGAPMAEFPQNLEAENPLLAGLYAPDDSPQALRPSRVNVRVLSPMNASESRARSRVFPIVDAATDADLPVEALSLAG